jgi:thioredoxin reductase
LPSRGATGTVTGMTYDAIVIGGGAAGLSAGLTLARARRRVLVLDGGDPRNAPAKGVHGLLTRDGIPPLELLRAGREDVARYGGEVRAATVTAAHRDGEELVLTTADGEERVPRIIVATGLRDHLPDIPGLRERWGTDVVHCPFCHGWEIRGRAIVILRLNAMADHQATLFRGWSDDVTVVPAEDVAALEADGLRLRDGSLVPCGAVAVAPPFSPRLDGLESLGLAVADHASGIGQHVEVDATWRTSVPGVWAAGNVADPMAIVTSAADQGIRAAGMLLMDALMTPAG